MNLCVVGTGYVGLVSGVCFAELGNKVICVDVAKEKIDKLNNGIMPIYEDNLEDMCNPNRDAGMIEFTTDLKYGIKNSDVIFIAVGTPALPNGQADLTHVETAAKGIAQHMNGYKIIVNKSTVPVGTQKWVAKVVIENQLKPYAFDVVSIPEFLREGTAIYDTMHPDRIVIGTDSQKAADILSELHEPFKAPILITDPESAEMIKYASNAFLAAKVTFINEIANICERVGADVTEVARGMGLDNRISDKFLNAGVGFGGGCFPKDTKALIKTGEQVGYDCKLVKSVVQVNNLQKLRPVEKLRMAMPVVKGKTIGILGLTFKPNTDDMREATSLFVINEIQKLGGKVKAYDPAGMNNARKLLNNVEYALDAYEAVTGVDAIILVTEWKEFKELDLVKVRNLAKGSIFIDGRNVFDYKTMTELGFEYYCIGKKDAGHQEDQVLNEVSAANENSMTMQYANLDVYKNTLHM